MTDTHARVVLPSLAGTALLVFSAMRPVAPVFTPPPATSGMSDTLFVESFESGELTAWSDGVDPERHRIVTDAEVAHSGRRFLAIRYPKGRDGGWLTHFLETRHDSLYVSWWVRFPDSWRGATKLIQVYGSRKDDRWSAFGKAGTCPDGADFFSTGIVTIPPGNPGIARFYTYYPGMRREPDGVTCWGRHGGDRGGGYTDDAGISRGRWHHIEFWIRLNPPGEALAEQIVWVDGRLAGIWRGVMLRSSRVLGLNAVQLSASMSGGAPDTQSLYIDDVVLLRARPPHRTSATNSSEPGDPR